MTNKEKAREIAQLCPSCLTDGINGCSECERAGKYLGALEMSQWKDQQYQSLVKTCKDLISILQMSRAYHLGITGLDSREEIERKEREGNTAVIRSIDEEIKYANEIINELFKKD